jgi:hypothetical protein
MPCATVPADGYDSIGAALNDGSMASPHVVVAICVFRDHPTTDSDFIRPLIPGHPATL